MKESQIARNISAAFTTLPALLFAAFSIITSRGEYFWLTYALMSVVFLTASALLGLFLPTHLHHIRLNQPLIWIVVQGALAWGMALLTLAALNMTPLCIGQDNGDGINDLSLCCIQTIGIAVGFTPAVLMLLGLSGFSGGVVLKNYLVTRNEEERSPPNYGAG